MRIFARGWSDGFDGPIYIMRIHGTFVNFLDLSPAIQEDIITRLEGSGFAA